MTIEERDSLSADIVKRIMDDSFYRKAETVFFYSPLGNEVNISPLFEDALGKGKHIAFPKVLSKNRMAFYEITQVSQLTEGVFGVMEPQSQKELPYTAKTLILVPGIAFDLQHYRLGFGAGFYDYYFGELTASSIGPIHSVGIGYDWQCVDALPIENHDIALERIIHN